MLRVALTGGVATGKSYVRARIASRGVPTVDADALVHQLFAAGSEVSREVARTFGPAMIDSDGAVDRRALGAIVFRDPARRRELEAIVHPRVYDRIAGWMSDQAEHGVRWVLAEVPLLFETGRDGEFGRVIVAACPADEQVRRLLRRGGIDEAAARARLAAQWPIDEKVRRATDIVDTSGSFEETDRQVDAICTALDEVGGTKTGSGRPPSN